MDSLVYRGQIIRATVPRQFQCSILVEEVLHRLRLWTFPNDLYTVRALAASAEVMNIGNKGPGDR